MARAKFCPSCQKRSKVVPSEKTFWAESVTCNEALTHERTDVGCLIEMAVKPS